MLLSILSGALLLSYWGLFWCLSWKYYQSEKESMIKLGTDRSVEIEPGCMGELFGGRLFSPRILVPDLHGTIKTSSIPNYFTGLSYGSKFILLLNVVDFF